MAATEWTDEDDQRVRDLRATGMTIAQIADSLQRTYNSINCRITRLGAKRGNAEPSAEPPREIPIEAFKSSAMADANERIASLEKKLHDALAKAPAAEFRVPVKTAAEPEVDMEEIWRRAGEDSARRIKHLHESSHATIVVDEFEPDIPVGLASMSDQHIAPGTPVDHMRMLDDAKLIRDTPGLYAILGGDGVDNHIKHRAAIMAARSQPGDQWNMYDYYLGILAEKLWWIISGNHDLWTNQIGGIDMVQQLATKNRLMYSPDEAHITAVLSGQEYRIAIRHQYRMNSSFNQTHAVKQWYRNGEELFDIGIVCHHHEPACEFFIGHGLQRWAARPGSYQISSAYSRQFGYNKTQPTCPTFILWPGTRRILGLPSVHEAAELLPIIRENWRRKRKAA